MISYYCKNKNQTFLTEIDLPEKGGWIHVESADSRDLETICSITGTSFPDLSDALDYHEVPRLERHTKYTILFIRHPVEGEGHLHTLPLLILMTADYFVTISPSKSSLIQEVLQRRTLSKTYKPFEYLLQILQRLSQEFSSEIRKSRHNVMDRKKEMHAADSEDIYSLTEHEEILNQYLSSLESLQIALEDLTQSPPAPFHEKLPHEIEDALNSIKQSETLCSILIKNIRSLRDSYQTIFTNKLTKTIKLLTALTIIFSIPNMIASIYGMNVRLPLSGGDSVFYLLLFFMFIVSSLCGYWFYRKKWM